jgi:hypothetical protein
MEKIKNILGLGVFEERITDKFERAFIKCIRRVANKISNIDEDIRVEGEMSALEERVTIVDSEEDKAYEKALRQLAKIRPGYGKYLPKRGKGNKIPDLSNLLKKKIRLAVWDGVGYKIPDRDLREVLVKNLLKDRGYAYRRNELRWYLGDLCVGKDLFDALKHLESIEAVDRRMLIISF